MQQMKYSEILKAVNGKLVCTGTADTINEVTTDSRKITEGALFIPLKGERFDGHDFVKSSLDAGASGALTQIDIPPVANKTIIKVEDTLKALADLARYNRARFPVPLIGITGSVGKTSTKDMVGCVLAKKFSVLKTEGNYNNEIGMPLTMLRLDETHEAAVVEMGMSGFGEINRLTSVAKPDIAIITNIGMSHIEKLGSRQNILKAKMEILEGLSRNGLVILNGDDTLLSGLKGLLEFRTVFYGMNEGLDYQAYDISTQGEAGTHFKLIVKNREYEVHVPVPGIHNVQNALAAIAAGIELGVPVEEAIEGIAQFSPGKMRQNIIKQNGIRIINDAYNASPQSMEAALRVLSEIAGKGRIIAVLGDMLELGEWAPKAHHDVGRTAGEIRPDYLITVGEEARNIAAGAIDAGMNKDRVKTFTQNAEVYEFLRSCLKEGDTVLVKGSRGMKMEVIVEQLTNSIYNIQG